HPRIRLKAEVFASRTDIEHFTDADGKSVAAFLIAHCRSTRLRVAVPLVTTPGEPGQWKGEIELDRRQLRGDTSLRAVLTNMHKDHSHRLLAASDPWTLEADRAHAAGTSGDFAPAVRWMNFRAPQAPPHLQCDPNQPYYLDLYGDSPVVYLNAGFPGLLD